MEEDDDDDDDDVLPFSGNTNKMQLVTEFIIPKFTEGSTCFEQHTAHHQEL
jgi:hypothetical protein